MSDLSILNGYKPIDFGLTEYESYRKHPVTDDEVQLEVVEFAAYCEKRFAAAAAPVGIGKMLIAITLAKLTNMRTAVVVPYKGLEDQYVTQLGSHLVDIRGRSNYTCADYNNLNCKGGVSMGCRYLSRGGGSGCVYERAKDEAKNANVVVMNYDYWLNVNDHVGGLQRTQEEAKWFGENPFELLILDEGDEASEKVADYLSTKMSEQDIKRWVDPRAMSDSIKDWKSMITEYGIVALLEAEIRTTGMELAFLGKKVTKQQVDVLHGLERLLGKYQRIATIQDDWVCEKREGTRYGRQWTFDVVWPGRYTEQYLFCNIPKVVIMSGTLTPKDMGLLGVNKEDFEYRQWASIFPSKTQPVYLCPPRKKNAKGEWVNININYKTKTEHPEDITAWIDWIDQFIGMRLDRKGLILTTSYDWQQLLMSRSRYGDLMIGNSNEADSESAADVAEQFYKMAAPRILVSPSFSRGWDFSGKRAEYVIIPKCPFVPLQSKVMKARLERDPLYGDHVTMKKVEQGNGRAKRSPDDRAETILMDGHFVHFLKKDSAKKLAQRWFLESVRTVYEIPPAPAKIA